MNFTESGRPKLPRNKWGNAAGGSGGGGNTVNITYNQVSGSYVTFDDLDRRIINITDDLWGGISTYDSSAELLSLDASVEIGGTLYTESILPIDSTSNKTIGAADNRYDYVYTEGLDAREATIHNLDVTGSMHVFELIIDKLKSVGGTVILSAASATLDKVVFADNIYKCYWRKEDPDRKKAISNDFRTNDQVICQQFNAQTGVTHNFSNKYYWRVVSGYGEENTEINGQTVSCNYILLSNTQKDGDGVPEAGDEIMQLGYRGTDDPDRQNAIILSASKTPDSQLKSPAICQYTGINDFNLASHKYTWFAGNGNNIRGNLKVQNGTSVEDLITEFAVDEDAIIAHINSSLGTTGIDIINQRITLTAANTVINGNLNLYDNNNAGLTVYDEDNVPRVNIQSDAIQSLSSMANDTYIYYSLSKSGSATSWDLTTSSQSISLSTNDTLDLDKFTVQMYSSTSSYPSNSSGTLYIIVENPSGGTKQFTVSISKNDNYGNYRNLTSKVRYAAKSSGNHKVYFRANIGGSFSARTTNLRVNARFQSASNTQTYIGRDGFYCHAGANKLIWAGEDELQLRYGFNGLRWNNADAMRNSTMQVVCGVKGSSPNYKPVWLPFYNFCPTFSVGTGTTPYLFTSMTIGNINETKYGFVVDPVRDCGICIVTSGYIDSNSNQQESWIVLPPPTFRDDNGDLCGLPTGYTITVVNWTSTNIYVAPYSSSYHGAVIIDANRNNNWFADLNGVQSRDTYIFVGNWAGLGNTWLSIHDTQ